MNRVIASPDHLLYSIEKHILDMMHVNYMKFAVQINRKFPIMTKMLIRESLKVCLAINKPYYF